MWIAYKTIVIKEVLRFSRIWVQTIFPPIITTSLYLLIFGGLMGERIGQMQGIDYLQYIIPGIILMTVITNSYANTVSSFFLAKFNHNHSRIHVLKQSKFMNSSIISAKLSRILVFCSVLCQPCGMLLGPSLRSCSVRYITPNYTTLQHTTPYYSVV